MLRIFTIIAALMTVGRFAHAGPDEDRSARARVEYENGMAHFNLEEWDAAIASWEEGYRIKPLPEFLYNIAQAYRLSKHAEKAISFYQKYLRAAPKVPNRAEVERQIASLQHVVAEQQRAADQPPQEPLQPPAKRGPESPPPPAAANPADEAHAAAPAASSPSEPTTAPRADLTARAPEKPIYRKAWFWGVVGGAAVVVAAAVVVGVVVGGRGSSNSNVLPVARF